MRPDPRDLGYEDWERNVKKFAKSIIRNMISMYLAKYNKKAIGKKRTFQKQGTTVGAIVDMIGRANRK